MSTAKGKTPAGKPARSTGLRFFVVALLLIVTAIVATALLANEQRNLKRVLLAFGLPTTFLERGKPDETTGTKRARRVARCSGVVAFNTGNSATYCVALSSRSNAARFDRSASRTSSGTTKSRCATYATCQRPSAFAASTCARPGARMRPAAVNAATLSTLMADHDEPARRGE